LAAADQLWMLELRRDELLDVLQQKGNQNFISIRNPAEIISPRGRLAAIWRSGPASDRTLLPQVIVGQLHDLEDLLAWASSYLRGLGPLTAQTRVITPDEYGAALQRAHNYKWWRFAGGFVGMVVGEALVHTSQTLISNDVGLVACRSTLSFVLARATALGVVSADLKGLGLAWEKLRNQTGQSTTAISAEEIIQVATSLSAATIDQAIVDRSRSRVSQWLFRLLDRGNADDLLHEFNDAVILSPKRNFRTLIAGTAEERVQFFDEVLPRLIEHSSFERTEKSFIIALVAFLSRPGLVHQMSLLHPTVRIFPDAPLWLGAMQALYSPEETLAYGDGLGWRLSRDIFEWEDVFSPPRHDISLTELQMVLRNRSLTRMIRFLPKNRLDVELSPGISTWIRSLSPERVDQNELPLDTRPSERVAAEVSAKSVRDVERSLEAALRIVRGIELPRDASSTGPRRRGRR
jgi:hypothetical protein